MTDFLVLKQALCRIVEYFFKKVYVSWLARLKQGYFNGLVTTSLGNNTT